MSEPSAPGRMVGPRRDRGSLAMVGVLAATLAVYSRCFSNGFVFDDDTLIVANRYIGQWSFFWKSLIHDSAWFRNPLQLPQSSYYRPLQDIWFAINYHLFGLNPAGWHATMVALHLIAVWLVFQIAKRVTADEPAAVLSATLFALMPNHADAVAWASAIPLSLAATFELGAFRAFIGRADAPATSWPRALLLYLGALFTHESAVAFPALILVYVFMLKSPDELASECGADTARQRFANAVRCAAPFIGEVLMYFVVRRLALGFFLSGGGLSSPATAAQAMLTVPLALATYLMLLGAPWLAGPAHDVVLVNSPAASDFWLPFGALVAITAALYLIPRNTRRLQLYLFWSVWIVITIAPMMYLRGLSPEELVQDRYLYLPSVGWCLMVSAWLIQLARRVPAARWLAWACAAAIAVLSASALWRVQRFYHDDLAFYSACLERFPGSARAHRRLGATLAQRGDLSAAEHEFEQSLKLNPNYREALYDLGLAQYRLGSVKQGLTEASEGLEGIVNAPAVAYVSLAKLYLEAGESVGGEAMLERAASLPGGDLEVGLLRAEARAGAGDMAGAETLYRALAGRHPEDHRVWAELGQVLEIENRDAAALSAYERAIKLGAPDPGPYLFAARTLLKMGRRREALKQCRKALDLAPNDRNAQALVARMQARIAPPQSSP